MKIITSKHLLKANAVLKAGQIGVTIQQIGLRLYLIATLPPKPDSPKTRSHQQRIPIGVANPEGLEYAIAKAKEIGGLLATKQFDWTPYLKEEKVDRTTIGYWIEELERDYFANREKSPTTLETWKHDYLSPLQKLPKNQSISEAILKKTLIENTTANSRNRRRYTLAYGKLADLAGLDHNLKKFIGNYSVKAVSPRSLPSDELIVQCYKVIDDRCWQWIYGVMATYGVRNHEVFFLDFEDYPIAHIYRGKTSERYVWPLFPEWIEQWGLREIALPKFAGKTNSQYGNKVTKAFKQFGLPFPPYNLRHAWARRSFEFGMDVTLAARQMGHGVDVHCDVYRHWIDKAAFARAYERLINHPDRPLPPTISNPTIIGTNTSKL